MPTTFENSKPDISCIYVNYRSAHFLERSLESVFTYEKGVSFEVIIVNNDSTEKEQVEAIGMKYRAKVIETFQNSGFGTAANRGAQEAEGKILFFVNPDTQWIESFFPAILRKFETVKSLRAAGIQLISASGLPAAHASGKAFVFPNRQKQDFPTKKIDWLSGAALFVPKSTFKKVGGFDERFFMYFEDMDLCMRLQEYGYTLFLNQNQKLVHFSGQSHSTKRLQKKMYDQSLYRYTKKHWSALQHGVFRVFHPLYRFFFPYGRK